MYILVKARVHNIYREPYIYYELLVNVTTLLKYLTSYVLRTMSCFLSPAGYKNSKRLVRNGGGWKIICSMPQKVTLMATKPRDIDKIKIFQCLF